ncbi:MAG: hypothetical protein M4579_001417 [Chaenotheca gracillima]|nr:MAG: hypothetical protein M4579_001417 [Chaenotheca gracillima]
MTSAGSIHESRKKIFASVFPSSPLASESPTPVATPNPSFVAAGQAFGVLPEPTANPRQAALNVASERAKWNRAWHALTTFLSLPQAPIPADLVSGQVPKQWQKRASLEVHSAFDTVLSQNPSADGNSRALSQHSILEWYSNEVRRHYLTFIQPGLQIDDTAEDAEVVCAQVLRTLQLANYVYLHPLIDYIIPALSKFARKFRHPERLLADVAKIEATFRRDLHAVVVYSLPPERVSSLLATVLAKECRIILGIPPSTSTDSDLDGDVTMSQDIRGQKMFEVGGTAQGLERDPFSSTRSESEPGLWRGSQFSGPGSTMSSPAAAVARQKVFHIFRTLKEVGLGQERGQRVFAEVMNKLMSEYVESAYATQWEAPSKVTSSLKDWVENSFAKLVVEVLYCLRDAGPEPESPQSSIDAAVQELVGFEDVKKWQEIGIGRLGALRVKQLFDIVVEWDASMGAMQDLKAYITTPSTRTHLTTTFAGTLLQRLLHPGASTLEILQAYISLIRSFNLLDPKGVLLDRVARPVRRYLRERDDTVRVIVAGLLANVEEDGDDQSLQTEDTLTELAVELNRASELSAQTTEQDGDLDWDDMEWNPDPIDAGPDYRKSKDSDVVGSLVSLFDSKDVFVKELQNVMGERLLGKQFDLEKEVRLLELLKLRFGEGALQACEVMLRDVRESQVMDRNIRNDESLQALQLEPHSVETENPSPPELHAKILSYLFWPELQEGGFRIPHEIADLQERYERGFEKLKQSRKLAWLHTLGQVKVVLELEDRTMEEEVQTWQASIIYAFQDDGQKPEHGPISKTITQLMTELDMNEGLVRNGVAFWIGKLVLRETSSDEFTVVESRDPDSGKGEQGTNMATLQTTTTSFVKSAEEVAQEKLQVYWQFIQGMLTNGGPMPLPQIVMMLKFTVTGGFPYGDEDLRQFLVHMIAQGKLEMEGDRYKIKR